MKLWSISLAAAMVAFLAGPSAQAADPVTGPRGATSQIDCRALAARPGDAAMSLERCQAQTAGMPELMQSMNQPGGERPGDDAMSCEQVIAELKAVSVPGVSQEHAAESLAAGRQLQTTYDEQMVKGQTLAAAQTARNAAAAGINLMTGTNLAGGIAAAQNQAETAALQAQAKAQMGTATSRAAAANANSRGDLAATWRANPRMARLTQLVMKKNCSMQ